LSSSILDAPSWRYLFALYKLAEMGASRRTVKVSTEYFAMKMALSQQTASRYLIQLEKKGWINRAITPEGCLVRITDSGQRELKQLYSILRLIFEAAYSPSITLEGTLFNGLGEGAYYVSKDGYRKQFIEKLGFDPYPGTLNLKLTSEYDMKTRMELDAYPAIELHGFENENRSFGDVKCYPVLVNNKVKGALLTALRTHYDSSVIEIVAPVYIRGSLKLKEGQKVKVEVLTLP